MQVMDYLVLRKCSGNSFCHYGHRLQTGLLRLLHARGLLARSPLPPPPVRSLCTRPVPSTSAEDSTVQSWLHPHLRSLTHHVLQALSHRLHHPYVHDLTSHYFTKGGKLIRPRVILLCAAALAPPKAPGLVPDVGSGQVTVAHVAEMIHTASLVHDDLIDDSHTRRGLPSVHTSFGNKAAVLAGDYILAAATKRLCSIGNPEVIRILSQVIEDLVKGEFMQLGDREGFDQRFRHYMEKTYKKTASLFANRSLRRQIRLRKIANLNMSDPSCEAVAVLSPSGGGERRLAFELGKQFGLAFQLMDDVLDCQSCQEELGKPAGADVRLGLATAPLLFAARSEPRLEPLIRRRFGQAGDAEAALALLARSHGLRDALRLAQSHAQQAARLASTLPPSPFSRALVALARAQTRRRA